MSKELSPSLEDYLLAVFTLSLASGKATVTDIARRQNVKKPSVIAAIKRLIQKGLVKQPARDTIVLTSEGFKLARSLQEKRAVLMEFFEIILNVDTSTARQEIHNIEHHISDITMERLKSLSEFFEDKPGLLMELKDFMQQKALQTELIRVAQGSKARIIENGSQALDQLGLKIGDIVEVLQVGCDNSPVVLETLKGRIVLDAQEAALIRVEVLK